MGRKKIAIKRIQDPRRRHVTFSRRKVGLMKKAYELSVLCGCDVGLVMISQDKVTLYSNKSMESIIHKYNNVVSTSPQDVEQFGDLDMSTMVDNPEMGGDFEDDEFGSAANENTIGEDEAMTAKKRKKRVGSAKRASSFGQDNNGQGQQNDQDQQFNAHFANIHRGMMPYAMASNDDFTRMNGMVNSGYYHTLAPPPQSTNAGHQQNYSNYSNYPPYYIFHAYNGSQQMTAGEQALIQQGSSGQNGDTTPSLAAIGNGKNSIIMISPSGSNSNLSGLPPFSFAHQMLPEMASSTNSLMIMANAASSSDQIDKTQNAETNAEINSGKSIEEQD